MIFPANAAPLLAALTQHAVPFVIIGGHAVNYHGFARATEDMDLVFVRTPQSELALFAALAALHAGWLVDERDPATGLARLVPVTLPYVQSRHLMVLSTDAGFVDIFDYIPGFPETPVAELLADAETLGGVRVVSLVWLRRLKQRAGRPQDLRDLEELS